jgi:hypothetical protein
MTEKNQLDQSPEGIKKQDGPKVGILETILEKSSDEEEIVDLTEVAAEALDPDGDIIDLLEEAGPEPKMEDKADIDLEDDDFAVFFEETEGGAKTDSKFDMEDGLIDLTDVAIEKTETDDNVIDLLDDTETNIDIGEDIIDLAEITDDFKDQHTTTDARIVQQPRIHDNDFVDAMGMDLTTFSKEIPKPVDADLKNEKAPLDLSGIPAGQLEEILKRIVDEMFSEKIEQMLATFIEKAVAREIERLKDLLLENPPDT